MKLKDTKVKNAKAKDKPYKLTDGDGMYLLIKPKANNGTSKLWRFDYRINGKRKTMAFGTYPEVSLERARAKRKDAREKIADGIDPASQQKVEALRSTAFESVALDWHSKKSADWVPSHQKKIKRRLEKDLFPYIGDRPIAEIEAPELLEVLRRIESRGALEMAHRARVTAGQVFRYAIATGAATRDISQDLRGALASRKVKHHASITDPAEIGKLLQVIDGYTGDAVTRAALKLSPHVFVRPGELRHAEWCEFDLTGTASDIGGTGPVWTIPAEKMKMRSPHIVPLSPQAVAILEDVQKLTGGGKYVFPGARSAQRPMSENTVNAALRRCGYTKEEMTAHGFRSMASTRLYESDMWPGDVIEIQLAHTERNSVKAAYNYAQHLQQRQKMMQWWSKYLAQLVTGCSVSSIHQPVEVSA